ncbi:MAG: hypothetical protein JWM12_664, partial [Ilumatobacteraceae bacterium]|nr:hypothetical protein [Ilumatobacteraceae bacterium]
MQAPHPPILVGGDSEPALRRVARLGDGWFPWNRTPAEMRAGPVRLDELLAAEGRTRADVKVQAGCVHSGTLDELRDMTDALAAEGVDEVVVAPHIRPREVLDRLAELPAALGLTPPDTAAESHPRGRRREVAAEPSFTPESESFRAARVATSGEPHPATRAPSSDSDTDVATRTPTLRLGQAAAARQAAPPGLDPRWARGGPDVAHSAPVLGCRARWARGGPDVAHSAPMLGGVGLMTAAADRPSLRPGTGSLADVRV